MRTTVNFHDFVDAFRSRSDCLCCHKFSYEGLRALFEMLEDYEEETGTELELDVEKLCFSFKEFASADEAFAHYSGMQVDIRLFRETETGGVVVEEYDNWCEG